ncbi:hypothetical protein ACT3SP_11570 [Brachybacterium sp. AOP43-C2-M15]|uniref:hypothetical protein n=1 Tax=Brachybacterium sp. AOP43-C2-M15 TaxID=3457661 RepID=UPI0040348BA5
MPPPTPPPPQRPRTGFWIAIACVLMLLALAFLAVTGGVVHLVVRGGSSGGAEETEETADVAETRTIEHEHFTFAYPATWFDLSDGEILQDSDGVAEVADVDIDPEDFDELATNSLTVYSFDSEFHAVVTCRTQATWIGFSWDESDDPQELDEVTVGGRELPAHRALGTHDGEDVVGEMYCADAGDEVVQIVAETHGASELSPQIRAILDSWTWVEG